MEILIILVLIGVAVVAGYTIAKANRGAPTTAASGPARASRHRPDELRIENVGPGGLYSLRAFGEQMQDMDVSVLARHVYTEDGWEWFELEGESELGKVWLTVEEDDETQVSASLRRLSFTDLGVTKEQLDRFDEEKRGSFEFENRDYVYADSGRAVFHRGGDRSKSERFYYWEFKARDETYLISVERWNDGSMEVHLSQPVKASQITVYSNTGAT